MGLLDNLFGKTDAAQDLNISQLNQKLNAVVTAMNDNNKAIASIRSGTDSAFLSNAVPKVVSAALPQVVNGAVAPVVSASTPRVVDVATNAVVGNATAKVVTESTNKIVTAATSTVSTAATTAAINSATPQVITRIMSDKTFFNGVVASVNAQIMNLIPDIMINGWSLKTTVLNLQKFGDIDVAAAAIRNISATVATAMGNLKSQIMTELQGRIDVAFATIKTIADDALAIGNKFKSLIPNVLTMDNKSIFRYIGELTGVGAVFRKVYDDLGSTADDWQDFADGMIAMNTGWVTIKSGFDTYKTGVYSLAVGGGWTKKSIKIDVAVLKWDLGEWYLPSGLPFLGGIADMKSGVLNIVTGASTFKDGVLKAANAAVEIAKKMIAMSGQSRDFLGTIFQTMRTSWFKFSEEKTVKPMSDFVYKLPKQTDDPKPGTRYGSMQGYQPTLALTKADDWYASPSTANLPDKPAELMPPKETLPMTQVLEDTKPGTRYASMQSASLPDHLPDDSKPGKKEGGL